jgi:hypothetical protein
MVTIMDISVVAVGTFISMCMFSTLYGKSNPLYAFAEESYIGFGTGLTIVWNVLYIWQTGFVNLMKGDWVLLLSVLLGIMILFRIHPKYGYVARLPIAVVVGAQLGLSLRTIIFTGFTQQIASIITPLFAGTAQVLIYNWTIAICVIFMLTFFFYTVEQQGILGMSAKFGEYLLYMAFGAAFAQTFMGRLSMFTGFMQSYTIPSWKTSYLIGSMIVVLVIVVFMDRTGLIDRLTPEE